VLDLVGRDSIQVDQKGGVGHRIISLVAKLDALPLE